ncbi:MAG: serine phosphatase RsbU (regulator of sigma subunit)/CHASE2 domain-containing sensor protein [Myxococcota bacterium]|jgi:serine phosphatase RsbU (regulator of sigma subunit)/CHASE2 domain-containing sensor protein
MPYGESHREDDRPDPQGDPLTNPTPPSSAVASDDLAAPTDSGRADPPEWSGWESLIIAGWIAAAIALLAVGLLRVPSPVERADRVWIDTVLGSQSDVAVDTTAVAVVLVDDEALLTMGERWPLRRSTWAALVETLSSYKPAAIVVDAWFEVAEPSAEVGLALDLSDKLRMTGLADEGIGERLADALDQQALQLDGDRRLGQAIGASGRVVLGLACVAAAEEPAEVKPFDEPVAAMLKCPGLSGNLPALAMAARGQAVLDVMRDDDGVLRRFPYIVDVDGKSYRSLALEAIRIGRPDDYERVLAQVRDQDQATPYQRAIEPQQFTTVRLSDLLAASTESEPLRAALQDRLVFVGVSAQGTMDRVFTVVGAPIPGVFTHANAAVDALGGRALVSGGRPARLAMGLGGLLLVLIAVGARRVSAARALVGIGFCGMVVWTCVAYTGLAAGWVLPVAPVWLGLGGWTLTRLGFGWYRIDSAKRKYRAQREQLLGKLTVTNAELTESLESLRRARLAKARMESELAIGQEIQLSMVPSELEGLDDTNRVDIAARLLAAREVGGDLYDYFGTPDGRLCVCVGDVSGKGVPAALFMAVAKTLVGALGRVDPSPASVVRRVNDELSRDNPNCMFVTLWLGFIDLDTGEVTYTNAGHNPPYVRRQTGIWERLTDLHGPVAGAMDDLDYEESVAVLAPGELLFLFTDGVVEAMNAASDLFEEERLVAVLEGLPDAGAAGATAACFDAVLGFTGDSPRADDITVLATRILPT